MTYAVLVLRGILFAGVVALDGFDGVLLPEIQDPELLAPQLLGVVQLLNKLSMRH